MGSCFELVPKGNHQAWFSKTCSLNEGPDLVWSGRAESGPSESSREGVSVLLDSWKS